jgi:signal transduction histidine kinase
MGDISTVFSPAVHALQCGAAARMAEASSPQKPSDSFSRLLARAVLVPFVLLAALALALAMGVTTLVRSARATERSDLVLAQASRLRELLVDRETALRGYLLSGNNAFLEPLVRADAELPTTFAQVRRLVGDDAQQLERLAHAEALAQQWQGFAEEERRNFLEGKDYITAVARGSGNLLMEGMRQEMDALVDVEWQHRASRLHTAVWVGRVLFLGGVGWVLALAAVLAYSGRRQLLQLAHSHQAALGALEKQNEALRAAEREMANLNTSLEHRVEQRTAALQAVNRDLEGFTYSVSHDLRAPLRQVAGFAEVLDATAQTKLDESERRALATLRDSARQSGQMMDDLLRFSKMSRQELRTFNVNLASLVETARASLAEDAEGREVVWTVGPLPEVRGDPSMLLLVFRNLLANALKYSRGKRPARIEVGSQLGPAGEDILYVRDNGVGFEMAHADRLFGVFQRLHGTEFEGTGIGLASVRRIVERHGGRVWAESRPGQGATFYWAIPRAPPLEAVLG